MLHKDRRRPFHKLRQKCCCLFTQPVTQECICKFRPKMADSPPSSSPADVLSRFLATSPTLIQDKISCVFDNLELRGLVQFWAPIKTTTGGRWLLTTLDQPFAIAKEINGGKKYRSCSVRYRYNIDMNKLEAEEDPTITSINGAAARAFLNRMPELLPDLRVHRITPLESTAVQCGLFRSVFLPIFDPSESCCVGVVECTTKSCCSLAIMLDGLHYGFGVCIFNNLIAIRYIPI